MSDPLWVDDITILVNSNKFVEFFQLHKCLVLKK